MPPKKQWEDESEEESSSGSEEESSPPQITAARRKFDDEEDSDEVVDSWDAEDSEEERKKAARAAAAKAKAEAEAAANKKPKSQRIEEHREAARRRRAAEEDMDSDDDDEDDAAKRARLRQTEQDADLKHAQDLFDNVGLGAKSRTGKSLTVIEDPNNPGNTIDISTLPLFKPSNKSQFDQLSTVLVPLITASSSKAQYSLWLQDFVKRIAAPLPSTEIKKAASGLTTQSNEKMKEEKNADKTGKKTKAAKTKATLTAGRDIGRGAADTNAYDDGLEEDDFM